VKTGQARVTFTPVLRKVRDLPNLTRGPFSFEEVGVGESNKILAVLPGESSESFDEAHLTPVSGYVAERDVNEACTRLVYLEPKSPPQLGRMVSTQVSVYLASMVALVLLFMLISTCARPLRQNKLSWPTCGWCSICALPSSSW
jgi:hypothetical protein